MAAEPAKKVPAPKEPASNVQPIKAKKRSKLPWIILAVIILAAAGAGVWFALKPNAPPATADAQASAASRAAPIYYKFDPAFVVNFGGEGSSRYLQVVVEAMARDAPVLEVLKDNDPAVRNDLLLLFSGQDNAALMTVDGKEKLRAATLAAIRKVLDSEGADGKLVEQVYFTSFVIQ